MDVTPRTVELDSEAFVKDTEPFRRELLAHCYRMLGSPHDAEDLVQETYLRASRAFGDFEGRSSVRTWLYRIATNACLSALTHRSRRVLPSGLGAPEPDPEVLPVPAPAAVVWLQPVPDALVSPESADPAVVATEREGLRLALIASLQYLPGRQRAVLILRDVLAFPATEVAAMLDTSTTAIKSTLQRARARLQELGLVAEDIVEPVHRRVRGRRRFSTRTTALPGCHLGSDPLPELVRWQRDVCALSATECSGIPWRLALAAYNGQRAVRRCLLPPRLPRRLPGVWSCGAHHHSRGHPPDRLVR
jgi:RNA polymerase sigma factor (sigma-70 family)